MGLPNETELKPYVNYIRRKRELLKKKSMSFISKGLIKNMTNRYREQGLTGKQIDEAIRLYAENQKAAEVAKIDKKIKGLYG